MADSKSSNLISHASVRFEDFESATRTWRQFPNLAGRGSSIVSASNRGIEAFQRRNKDIMAVFRFPGSAESLDTILRLAVFCGVVGGQRLVDESR